MKRYLNNSILMPFVNKKIVLIMGPRQVGKTTLSKSLCESFAYYNYDIKKHINTFLKQEWDQDKELVIFDELHKMKKWKLWLKGIYDDDHIKKQKIIVTGSARLDIAKKMGDSLAGRFYSFRLNPFDLKELFLLKQGSVEKNYEKMLTVGGFPEPFIDGSKKNYNIWRRSHQELILRQDLISLEQVRDINGIELLVELLAQRVGSTISIHSLAEDLDRDDKTVKRWLTILENLYVIFKVNPKSKNMARGIKKSSKYYFYDIGKVDGDESIKLENLVALSLKKEIEFLEDTSGLRGALYFLKTKEQKEIDFFIERAKKRPLMIEVKLSDASVSKNFELFKKFVPDSQCIQLVKNLDRKFTNKSGVTVSSALEYLCHLDLSK